MHLGVYIHILEIRKYLEWKEGKIAMKCRKEEYDRWEERGVAQFNGDRKKIIRKTNKININKIYDFPCVSSFKYNIRVPRSLTT